MEQDPGNRNHLTTESKVLQNLEGEQDKHTLKSTERKKKLKRLKEENKRLKQLLQQIGRKVSNSGLLSSEQQNALTKEIQLHEDASVSDDNFDIDQNSVVNEKKRNDVSSLEYLDLENDSETNFSPPNFVTSPTNLDRNNGFQFGVSKYSADVSSSAKQNLGRNYFLSSFREVVQDPHATDYLDVAAYELSSLRQQVCMRNEDFAPISPLPPTPPPKSNDSKPNDVQNSEKTSHETNNVSPNQTLQESNSSVKKHSFSHQQSEGFDVPIEQPNIGLNAFPESHHDFVPAPRASNSRLGKYEFISKRSADGGVLLTFSLSDNISVSLDSNTWQITCRIPDPQRKSPECTPLIQSENPGQPNNNNFGIVSNSLEVHEPVPCKKQKLSSSEKSAITVPSMKDVQLGNLGKRVEQQSRELTQGSPNVVPNNLFSPQSGILGPQSETHVQSNQDQIFPHTSVASDNEIHFQAVEDNRSIVSSSSESTSPSQLHVRKLFSISTEKDDSNVKQINILNSKEGKKEELTVPNPNNHVLNTKTSNFESIYTVNKSPKLSMRVSTSESDNSNSERNNSLSKSLKKRRKRNLTINSDGNAISTVNFIEQTIASKIENNGPANRYLLTSSPELSVFKKPKRMPKKQRNASSPVQATGSTSCKSVNSKKQANKSNSKCLMKTPSIGSEEADCSSVNSEESDYKHMGKMQSELLISLPEKKNGDINKISPAKIGKGTEQIMRQSNISNCNTKDEKSLIETMQNGVKTIKTEITTTDNRENKTSENRWSLSKGTKQNGDSDYGALFSFVSPDALLTTTLCENSKLFVPSYMINGKSEVSHEAEAENNNPNTNTVINSCTEGSIAQNSIYSTFKSKNGDELFNKSENCVQSSELKLDAENSFKNINSEPTSDQSNKNSDEETINSTPNALFFSDSKIDNMLLPSENKSSNLDFIQNSHKTSFNQIELGSFDPNAFTGPNYVDELGLNISGSEPKMLLSSTTSKNLLKDDIFSFLNADHTLRSAMETGEKNQKESSSTGFSFLNSNAFPLDSYTSIKKETMTEVIQNETMQNSERIQFSPVKNQLAENTNHSTLLKAGIFQNDPPQIKDEFNSPNISSTLPHLEVSGVEIEVKTEDMPQNCTEISVIKTKSPGYLLEDSNEEIDKIPDASEMEANGFHSKSTPSSVFLKSESKNKCDEGTEYDSGSEHALVIADDAMEAEHHMTESEMNISEDEPSCMSATGNSKASPKEKRKRKPSDSTRKNNNKSTIAKNGCVNEIQTDISIILKTLDKLRNDDFHMKQITENLCSAFINPHNTLCCIIYLVVKYLSVSRKNPMISYALNRNSSLLPLSENCIVTALFSSNNSKQSKLIPSVVRTIYDITLAKQKINIYGLCSLCRVLTEICKRNKDKKLPISLCCDLVSTEHRFAPYMVASIVGVWKDLFTVSAQSKDEERILFGVIALAVQKKTKPLTHTQWNHCYPILCETLTVKLQPDLKYTIEFIEKLIKIKCSKGLFANTFRLTMSLVIIAQIQDWQSTKELMLDNFVIPSLQKYACEETNEKAFSLFCILYGNISAYCPYTHEPIHFLTNLFGSEVDTFVREAAAIALLKLLLTKNGSFPDYLEKWLDDNTEIPMIDYVRDWIRRHLISETEFCVGDVLICE